MREKVSTASVVGISVRVGELVVDAVIAAPDVDAVLTGDRLTDGPEDPKRQGGIV